MSRPRSRSPRNSRFPWDEPDFNPDKILAALDASLMDRRHQSREGQKEQRDYFKGDLSPHGQGRSSPCSDDFHFSQQHHHNREESYRQRLSPRNDVMHYGDRGFSPLRDEGPDGDRHRGPFRDDFERFDNRVRSPHSPLRLQRERLPPSPRPGSRGRFRDFSPPTRGGFRGGAGRERGRRVMQGPNRERQRENFYQEERSLPPKRHRREMDDSDHFGYRNKEEFGEQRYSLGTRDGFGRGTRGGPPRGGFQHSRPFVIDHNHRRMDGDGPSWWKPLDSRHERSPDFNRQRSPHPTNSSQDRSRTPNSRTNAREDTRGSPFRDNWRDSDYHDNRRSPPPQDRSNSMMYGNRGGPPNKRGMNNSRPDRDRFDRNQRGKMGPQKSQSHFQQPQQRYQDVQQQRLLYRGQREDGCDDAINEEPNWAKEDRLQQWEPDRPGGLNRQPPRANLDPKMPHHREQGWTDQKSNNMTVVTEETLTIKVDMSRPVSQKSQLCYSSDRQLSFDLVNVGRQRLDFLPMLEHSGTYRETAMHKGTFAQEIITLVHHVKELYFKGDSITLNERFSAPQKGGYTEEQEDDDQGEAETLTLDKRFSAHRGFSLNLKPLLDDNGLLFEGFGSGQGLNQQPMRGPGDLRHDLERRRQEKLEGVKVTIPGKSLPQRPLGPSSNEMEYSDKDDMAQLEDEEFSSWPEEQSRRWEGNSSGPRRGAPYRTNAGPQRRNPRQRLGPNRRQNHRMNPAAGSYW